jgi:hypothetical protein
MSITKRALAQIRLYNSAKAKTLQLFFPLVKTNGNEVFANLNSFLEPVKK